MKQKAFVVYPSWRTYMDLLEDPELIKEFAYALFAVGEGKEPQITDSKVETAINAIKPIMDENNAAYEDRCRKNKAAARRRWSNANADVQQMDANAYQSDANAFHSDGDNDNDNDHDNDDDDDDDNDNKNCLSCQAVPSDIPSEAEVIQAAEIRGMTFSEEEARHFTQYYFVEKKGCIGGEPIRSWRSLLRGWNLHTLVDPQELFGDMITWYHKTVKYLPEGLRTRIEDEQGQFSNCITKETAKLVQDYLKERR